MEIRWRVSKNEIFGVSFICLLGTLLLIYYNGTSKLRMNPCRLIDSDHNLLPEPSGSRKCIREGKPSMLTASIYRGRLGNQMNQYATLFAVGRYNNREAFMSQRMSDFISKYFNVTLDTLDQKLFDHTPWCPWTNKRVGGVVDSSIRKLTHPFVRLYSLPQSWKYFHELRPLILNQFRFYDDIDQKSKTKLRSIRDEFFPNNQMSMTFVGIHVRRSDYVKSARNEGFYLPGMKFYEGAMLYFQRRYEQEQVIFIVSTDDIPWCIENFRELKDKFRTHVLEFDASSNLTVGLDMATLTHCHHVIYSIGTFGFWAGYLNPGQVIFCSDCFTPTSTWLRDRNVFNGDYGIVVLPSWIGYSRNGTRTDRSALPRSTDLLD